MTYTIIPCGLISCNCNHINNISKWLCEIITIKDHNTPERIVANINDLCDMINLKHINYHSVYCMINKKIDFIEISYLSLDTLVVNCNVLKLRKVTSNIFGYVDYIDTNSVNISLYTKIQGLNATNSVIKMSYNSSCITKLQNSRIIPIRKTSEIIDYITNVEEGIDLNIDIIGNNPLYIDTVKLLDTHAKPYTSDSILRISKCNLPNCNCVNQNVANIRDLNCCLITVSDCGILTTYSEIKCMKYLGKIRIQSSTFNFSRLPHNNLSLDIYAAPYQSINVVCSYLEIRYANNITIRTNCTVMQIFNSSRIHIYNINLISLIVHHSSILSIKKCHIIYLPFSHF